MVKRNSTLKKGGDLEHSTFKGILSIGYEFETGGLSKLTYTPTYENEGMSVLFNSDTARKDIEIFESPDFVLDEDDLEYDNIVLRQEETVSLPVYKTNSEEIDYDSKFYITNDFSEQPFTKHLSYYCGDEVLTNEMYKIIDSSEKEYSLHFVNSSEKVDIQCGTFSVVEWIYTYFRPNLSENIIMNTFVNAIQNLIHHLEQLEVEDVKMKYYYSNEEDDYILITNPVIRKLFHLPDTNLYYFQSQYLTKQQQLSKGEFSINQIMFVPQMTFACHVNDILRIMRSMIYHYNIIDYDSSELYQKMYKILIKIQNHVTELIQSFDPSLLTNKKIFTYLTLIFYKLHQYYNYFLIIDKSERKYFKNSLFFNVRHSNYVLYLELKKEMMIHYAGSSENDVIELIRDLMCQETILNKFLNVKKKNVFKREPFIEKPTEYVIDPKTYMPITRYGNLEFSFISYLQFFEDPLENTYDDNFDWLVYAGIDSYSQRMDIRNDILLVEVRFFSKVLHFYFSKIQNEEFQTYLTNNKTNGYSVHFLKHFLEIYNSQGLQQKSKKSKTRRRSKK